MSYVKCTSCGPMIFICNIGVGGSGGGSVAGDWVDGVGSPA